MVEQNHNPTALGVLHLRAIIVRVYTYQGSLCLTILTLLCKSAFQHRTAAIMVLRLEVVESGHEGLAGMIDISG